jgi:predicted esterase
LRKTELRPWLSSRKLQPRTDTIRPSVVFLAGLFLTFLMVTAVICDAKEKHTATVIFLHGLGDSGHGWSELVPQLQMPHVKFMFPNAPSMPVSLNMGMSMPAWFDLYSLDDITREDIDGMQNTRALVERLVQKEIDNGIPASRIVIGGFSQGGAIALFTGLSTSQPLAGILCLSGWLPGALTQSVFPAAATEEAKRIPLLMLHGERDQVVKLDWARNAFAFIQGVLHKVDSSQMKTYPHLEHSSSPAEIADMRAWLKERLP